MLTGICTASVKGQRSSQVIQMDSAPPHGRGNSDSGGLWLAQGHRQPSDLRGPSDCRGLASASQTCPSGPWLPPSFSVGLTDTTSRGTRTPASKWGKWSLLTITSVVITIGDSVEDPTLDSPQILSIPISGCCSGPFPREESNCSLFKAFN